MASDTEMDFLVSLIKFTNVKINIRLVKRRKEGKKKEKIVIEQRPTHEQLVSLRSSGELIETSRRPR